MKHDENITISRERYNSLLKECILQSERIAKLEIALQPFSDEAAAVRDEFGPSPDNMTIATLCYGYLRKAELALEEDDNDDT